MNQPDATPERLILAARKLFAEKGFDRASVRAITRHAKANLGAVTYHFGSKDRLRDEVLTRMVAGLAARLEAVAALPLPAAERLPRLVQAVFAHGAEHPDTPHLLVRFLLHTGRLPAPVIERQRVLIGSVMKVIQDGIAAREFRPVNPFLAAFTLMSQCIWFHLIRGVATQISSASQLDSPEGASVMAAHISDVVLRALAPAAR
jgi:AcrR family transcriptional regulator